MVRNIYAHKNNGKSTMHIRWSYAASKANKNMLFAYLILLTVIQVWKLEKNILLIKYFIYLIKQLIRNQEYIS